MRRSTISAFLLILIASGIACAQGDKPITVSGCELRSNPDAYDHKLIQLQGTVSSEFEDFSLRDKVCPDFTNTPWLTYCGDIFDGVMYSCDGPDRKDYVVAVGITPPMTKDPVLERFTRLVDSYRFNRKAKHHYFQTDPTFSVTATLVGRFFAGKPSYQNSRRGFGHMGCCTLLVIQKVVSIDNVVSNLKPGELTYYIEGWNEGNDHNLLTARQKSILQSGEAWRKSDPQRVAADALSSYRKNSATSLTFLGCTTKHLTYGDKEGDQYSTRCNWESTPSDFYAVDVMKYDFLKTRSNKWRDIAWMPDEITHTHYSASANPE